MQDNQQAFMQRLRSALQKPAASFGTTVLPESYGAYAASQTPEQLVHAAGKRTRKERLELLGLLKESAAPLNLHVHSMRTIKETGEAIAERIQQSPTEWGGVKEVCMHDHPVLKKLSLPGRLKKADIPVHMSAAAKNAVDKKQSRKNVEASFVGITTADWCVANSATLAIMTTPETPRSTSLVPSIHIAVIKLNQLLADLPELYAQLEAIKQELPTSFTFVSGPSKTADIEAHMVHGAHGPREMHLYVITG